MCEKAGSTEYGSGEKIVGQDFSLCSEEYNRAASAQAYMRMSTEGEEMKRQAKNERL